MFPILGERLPQLTPQCSRTPTTSARYASTITPPQNSPTSADDGSNGPSGFQHGNARLRRIIKCIRPNHKNKPNLDLYLVQRYKICHFPKVVSYLCIGQNLKNHPNLVLHLVQRSKIFASVATLVNRLPFRWHHSSGSPNLMWPRSWSLCHTPHSTDWQLRSVTPKIEE